MINLQRNLTPKSVGLDFIFAKKIVNNAKRMGSLCESLEHGLHGTDCSTLSATNSYPISSKKVGKLNVKNQLYIDTFWCSQINYLKFLTALVTQQKQT